MTPLLAWFSFMDVTKGMTDTECLWRYWWVSQILFYKSAVNLNIISNILIGKGKLKHQRYKQVIVLNLCSLGLLNIFPLNKIIKDRLVKKLLHTHRHTHICVYIHIYTHIHIYM